jgi:hypothetical protein
LFIFGEERRLKMRALIAVLCVLNAACIAGAETFFVSGTSGSPVYSQPLTAGTQYLIEASGVFDYTYSGAQQDAAFYNFASPAGCYNLLVGGQMAAWQGTTDGITFAINTYSPTHIYHYSLVGQGASVPFVIYDTTYADNSGQLQVSITPVPEPATLSLLALGSLVSLRKRK